MATRIASFHASSSVPCCYSHSLDLVLVDHNRLCNEQKMLRPAVRQVFDHHDLDEPFHTAERVVVEPVGSCASLVARESKLPFRLKQQLMTFQTGAAEGLGNGSFDTTNTR